jgi:hypothetical protein
MNTRNKTIKEILSLYNVILENKNINEASNSYDNVNFNNTVVKDANPLNDNINTALLQDIETAAKSAGVVVDITTAISGHKEKTESGNTSRHVPGNAVDIAIVNGVSVRDSTIRDKVLKFVDELVKLGYEKNLAEIESRPKVVLTYGFEGHDNHVHVSNTTQEASSNKKTETEPKPETSSTNLSSQRDPIIAAAGNMLSNMLGLKENINRIKNLL